MIKRINVRDALLFLQKEFNIAKGSIDPKAYKALAQQQKEFDDNHMKVRGYHICMKTQPSGGETRCHPPKPVDGCESGQMYQASHDLCAAQNCACAFVCLCVHVCASKTAFRLCVSFVAKHTCMRTVYANHGPFAIICMSA